MCLFRPVHFLILDILISYTYKTGGKALEASYIRKYNATHADDYNLPCHPPLSRKHWVITSCSALAWDPCPFFMLLEHLYFQTYILLLWNFVIPCFLNICLYRCITCYASMSCWLPFSCCSEHMCNFSTCNRRSCEECTLLFKTLHQHPSSRTLLCTPFICL